MAVYNSLCILILKDVGFVESRRAVQKMIIQRSNV